MCVGEGGGRVGGPDIVGSIFLYNIKLWTTTTTEDDNKTTYREGF